MYNGKVKIEIGDTYWLFADTVKVEMLQADPNGGHGYPYKFCLNIETIPAPLVYKKIQDGNVTEYVRLA